MSDGKSPADCFNPIKVSAPTLAAFAEDSFDHQEATISLYKVCVYAICKNEEKFIDRWMDAVQEADMVVVLDTGSTDSSVAKLRARGAHVYEQAIVPWRFDTARNIAMDHIPDDVDICVSNDIDEVFEPGWRAGLEECWTPETTRANYFFVWQHHADGSAAKQSHQGKIHRRRGFRWVHPVHEVLRLSGSESESVAWADGVVLHHRPDPTKSRSQYLPLLELSAEENPEDVYNDRLDDAIATLQRHLDLKGQWDVERCASMRFIAKAHQVKGDLGQARIWLYRAIAERPDTREPYHQMAVVCYLMKDWSMVLAMAEKTLAITNEGGSGYLRELDCWGMGPYDLAAIATYWLGLYERSYEYASKALEMDPTNGRLADNVRFALDKLEQRQQ